MAKYTSKNIHILNPASDSYEDMHTLRDGDLFIGICEYNVVANGRHYNSKGYSHSIEHTTAYLVPYEKRDTPGTPENKAYLEILQAIKLATVVENNIDEKQKILGKIPGHMYFSKKEHLFIYFGKKTLVDPTSLQTISGHIYMNVGYLLQNEFAVGEDGQLTVSKDALKDAPIVDENGVADYTVLSRHRSIELKVTKNPASFIADIGEYTDKNITGLMVHLNRFFHDEDNACTIRQDKDLPATFMPMYPVGKKH